MKKTPKKDDILPALAKSINRCYSLIKKHESGVILVAIEVGELLIAAKKAVGYGGWEDWIHENTGITPSQVTKYMRIAAHQDIFANLDPSQEVTSINEAYGTIGDAIRPKLAPKSPAEIAEVSEKRVDHRLIGLNEKQKWAVKTCIVDEIESRVEDKTRYVREEHEKAREHHDKSRAWFDEHYGERIHTNLKDYMIIHSALRAAGCPTPAIPWTYPQAKLQEGIEAWSAFQRLIVLDHDDTGA